MDRGVIPPYASSLAPLSPKRPDHCEESRVASSFGGCRVLQRTTPIYTTACCQSSKVRSLNQSDRIAEARMLGAFEPFEHDHLGRDDLGAVPLHAANCGLLALRLTRAESVPYDVNLPSRVQQTENGLQHAHMGLAAGSHDVPFRRNRSEEARLADGIERHLVHYPSGADRQIIHRHRDPSRSVR